jgi:hypothetical protein
MKMEVEGSSVKFTATYKTACCHNQNTTIQIRAVVWEMYYYVALMMNALSNVILADSRVTLKTQEFLKLLHVAFDIA